MLTLQQRIGEEVWFWIYHVIAENKEKHINFNVNISVDKYKTPLGEMKQIMRQLRFINSVRFMASTLDSLSRNLVGTVRMACKGCGSEADVTQIDENYVADGVCGRCQGASLWKLEIDPIFNNLKSR